MRLPRNSKTVLFALAGIAGVRIASRLLHRRRLDGQVVFVTGGSRGLGLSIALECGRRGAHVALAARNEAALHRAAQQVRERGGQALPLVCDVRNRDEIERSVHRAHEHFGRLDVLVNNAGTIAVGPMEDMTQEDYRDALDTHFWAMYYAV
ncbi:MAG: SDR family NAD(P)-dependent oxidoreductase, partial [Candidatus Baltobacteraceae bacterium]